MSDPTSAKARFVRWVMRDVTFDKDYAARVEFDHGNQTFDLVSDDEEIRGTGLQRVPVLVGIAGARVRALPGTRCVVGFSNRDPREPRIVAWEYEPNKARITFDNGIAGLARQGDPVKMLLSEGAPVSGMLGGTVTQPGPPPFPVPVPSAPFVGVVTGITAQRSLLTAQVIGGARGLRG